MSEARLEDAEKQLALAKAEALASFSQFHVASHSGGVSLEGVYTLVLCRQKTLSLKLPCENEEVTGSGHNAEVQMLPSLAVARSCSNQKEGEGQTAKEATCPV
eukprot:g25061.t1